METLLFSRKDAAMMLGICVRSLDHAVSSGHIKARRLGRRVLFTLDALRKFAARDQNRAFQSARSLSKGLRP